MNLRQLAALLVFSVVARAPFAIEPPGRDQSLFVAQADLVLAGARLYEQVWEHKPPGILSLYALARGLLGRNYVAVHALSWAAGLSSALMLYALARRSGLGTAAALFGGLVYLAFFTSPLFGGYWAVAQSEVFLDPLLGGALLLLVRPQAGPSPRACLGAGALIGAAIAAIKYSALPLLALGFLCRHSASRGRAFAAFAAGSVLPGLAIASYFAATGRGGAWFDATVRFNLHHAGVGAARFLDDPFGRLLPAPFVLLVLYGFAAVALASRTAATAGVLRLGVGLWLLALLQVALQRKFWVYHYHVLLFPLSWLAALGFERARALMSHRLGARRALSACVAIAALASFGQLGRVARYVDEHELLGALTGRVPMEQFYFGYTWGNDDYNYGVDRWVAAQVAAATRPGDRIFVFGFEPALYTLAGRTPAARFLYDYPVSVPRSPLQQEYLRLLMRDLQAHPPSFVVVLRGDRNALEPQDSQTQLAALGPLAAYLERGYAPAWTLGHFIGLAAKQPAAAAR